MPRMTALKTSRYGRLQLKRGVSFEADPRHVRVLQAARLAELAPVAPPTPKPPAPPMPAPVEALQISTADDSPDETHAATAKRTYKRRDVVAE